MIRPDAWLIKEHMRNEGLESFKWSDYLLLPFVDLSSADSYDSFRVDGDAFAEWAHTYHLPWENFIVALPGIELEAGLCCAPPVFTVRQREGVTKLTIFLGDTAPRNQALAVLSAERQPGADFRLIAQDFLGTGAPHDERADSFLNMALSVLTYLGNAPDQFVEVTRDTTKRDQKSAQKMPWARHDLPRIVLMSPEVAKLHGHRADRGGTHASPRIHQRRGHWKKLRHDRYRAKKGVAVWCKPTWVGEREWQHQGTRYRVGTPQLDSVVVAA